MRRGWALALATAGAVVLAGGGYVVGPMRIAAGLVACEAVVKDPSSCRTRPQD
ncbi:hypothetical protein [Streptomyces gardneri]|uniref:hypothetical protein n=1 Tax=Streptomyces gardneri TaxID=66892 RepID=UPI003683CE2A